MVELSDVLLRAIVSENCIVRVVNSNGIGSRYAISLRIFSATGGSEHGWTAC